jgi:hypothetical protein
MFAAGELDIEHLILDIGHFFGVSLEPSSFPVTMHFKKKEELSVLRRTTKDKMAG